MRHRNKPKHHEQCPGQGVFVMLFLALKMAEEIQSIHKCLAPSEVHVLPQRPNARSVNPGTTRDSHMVRTVAAVNHLLHRTGARITPSITLDR